MRWSLLKLIKRYVGANKFIRKHFTLCENSLTIQNQLPWKIWKRKFFLLNQFTFSSKNRHIVKSKNSLTVIVKHIIHAVLLLHKTGFVTSLGYSLFYVAISVFIKTDVKLPDFIPRNPEAK